MDQKESLALFILGRWEWNNWAADHYGEQVSFSGEEFDSEVDFTGFVFPGRVLFINTKFKKKVRFHGAAFEDKVWFVQTSFHGDVIFHHAKFMGMVFFAQTRFEGKAEFSGVEFGNVAWFAGATFELKAKFDGAKFAGYTCLTKATFRNDALFAGTKFTGNVEFQGAWFEGKTQFDGTLFAGAVGFDGANIKSHVRFAGATIKSRLDLSTAKFEILPDLRVRDGERHILLPKKQLCLEPLGRSHWLRKTLFGQWTTNSKDVEDIRVIRGIAAITHAIDTERDLFILERQAELGVLWHELNDGRVNRDYRLWTRSIRALRLNSECNTSFYERAVCFCKKIVCLTRSIGVAAYQTVVPMHNTAMMMLYRWSSNYGRSVALPVFWLFVTTLAFNQLYQWLYAELKRIDTVSEHTAKLLEDFTRGSLIPFASTTRPSYQSAIEQLFTESSVEGPAEKTIEQLYTIEKPADNTVEQLFTVEKTINQVVDIPVEFQNFALAQGVLDLILIFLIGLAIRNYFRVS